MLVYIFLISLIFTLLIIDKFNILPNVIIFKKKKADDLNHAHCLEIKDKNYKNLSGSFILATLIIFSFAAFRHGVGWDYMAYYNTIEYNATTNIISNGEYLNIFLIEISRIFNMPNIYFFINAFILIFMVVKTIKVYSKDPWLSLLLFIGFPLFYLNSLSVIRLFSALAISFYGFKYIEKKSFCRFVVTILIAIMFHKSAIIALAFYFLKDIKLNTYKLALILALLPLARTLLNNVVFRFFPRYTVYTQPSNIQEGTKAIFVFLVIGLVALLFRNKVTRNDYVANIYFNLFYVGLGVYIMFFNQGTMGHRLSLYGTIYSLLLVPHIVSVFKGKKERMLAKALIYGFCILAFLYTIYVGAETYVPYRTIWSKY